LGNSGVSLFFALCRWYTRVLDTPRSAVRLLMECLATSITMMHSVTQQSLVFL